MILHLFQFASEAEAKAALPTFLKPDGTWRDDYVDPGIKVTDDAGNTRPGYYLNANLPALDTSLPGLTAAGTGPADDFTLLFGTQPETPQETFFSLPV